MRIRAAVPMLLMIFPAAVAARCADSPATQPTTQEVPENRPTLLVPVDSKGPRHIVFVSDAPMQLFGTLRSELSRSVHSFNSSDRFGIIITDEKSCLSFSDHLLAGTQENRLKAEDFLTDKVIARGVQTDPLPALDAAFKLHPDVIDLVGYWEYADNKAVLDRIRQLNAGRHVKINTFFYTLSIYDEPKEFVQTLRAIAKESGGAYRRLNEDEMPW